MLVVVRTIKIYRFPCPEDCESPRPEEFEFPWSEDFESPDLSECPCGRLVE